MFTWAAGSAVATGAGCGGFDGWNDLPGMPPDDYTPCWAEDYQWPNVGACCKGTYFPHPQVHLSAAVSYTELIEIRSPVSDRSAYIQYQFACSLLEWRLLPAQR